MSVQYVSFGVLYLSTEIKVGSDNQVYLSLQKTMVIKEYQTYMPNAMLQSDKIPFKIQFSKEI